MLHNQKAPPHLHQDTAEQFQGLMPVMQQMIQTIQQLKSQQQPQDPSVAALVQTQMAETQRKAKNDTDRLSFEAAKLAADTQAKQEKNVADQQIKAAELTHDINLLTLEQQHEQQRQQLQAQQEQQIQAQQAAQAAQPPTAPPEGV